MELARLISAILTVFLVALFLRAAWHKAQAFWETTGFVADYSLLPAGREVSATRVLIGAEVLVIAMLMIPATRPFGAALAACLLLIYAFAMAWALRVGRRRIDCGCGGAPHFVSGLTVGRNLVLAAMACILALLPAGPLGGVAPALIGLGLGLTTWTVYAVAERLLANAGHISVTGLNRPKGA